LRDLATYSVKKAEAAHLALEYIETGRKNASEVAAKIREANRSRGDRNMDKSRFNDAYIAGLFAADGSIALKPRKALPMLSVDIAQSSFTPLLYGVRDYLGFGSVVKNGHWQANSNLASSFLRRIQCHIIGQKKAQLDLVMHWSSNRPSGMQAHRKRTAEEIQGAAEIAKKLKAMKKR